MMCSTRIRQNVPVLPRVEDLERSKQWTGLACEIGNLERSSILHSRARRSPVKLENSMRARSLDRRSLPEAPKPDLVYVRITNREDLRSMPHQQIANDPRTSLPANSIQMAGVIDRWSWKPRTEFERNYFGSGLETPFSDEETPKSSTNYSPTQGILTNGSNRVDETKNSSRSVTIGNDESFTGREIPESRVKYERPRSSGFNRLSNDLPEIGKSERRRTCAGSSFYYEHSHEVPKKIEFAPEVDRSFLPPHLPEPPLPIARDPRDSSYKKPIDAVARRYASNDDDSEYRGSRERLHEIFEHNRLLRRQFFASMPGGSDTGHTVEDAADSRDPLRGIASEIPSMRNRLDFPKNTGTGFGSTETLTSQSNQSGASSTNGRKSRVDFGNSPEPLDESRIFATGKIDSRHSNGFETSKSANSPKLSEQAAFSYTHLPLPSKSVTIDRLDSREDDCDSLVCLDESARRIFVERNDRLKESPIDTTADFDTTNSSRSPRERTDSLDSDQKFFATYVRVENSSGDSSKASSPTRRKNRPIPPPLDLSTIEQRYDDRYEGERQFLNNYTVEVTPLRDYERPAKGVLTVLRSDDRSKKSADSRTNVNNSVLSGSKSLLELSANLSKTPSSKVVRSRLNTGLSATVEDLRSPQLVSNFSNSMIDLVHSSEHEEFQRSSRRDDFAVEEVAEEAEPKQEAYSSPDAARRKSIGSATPGTGTTLPLVYGPIPYKSPRRYVEGEVTIHYRSPVRQEAKEILSEEELARRSAENMRRVYQEERRRKYLQELHDIDSRRHTDNFVASQKSPISLNRYDDFVDDLSYRSRSQEQTPEPRLVARALYNFVGQSSRELTFRRGDIIFVRRQVDKNWYEGEHNAMIGLFPFNYVEILPFDGTRTTPKKPYEGQARAKFNFVAQTNLELSLAKGELVVITRRVDENWYEGRIGNRKGIFPISYVEVLAEPGHRSETPVQSKPVASPAAHSLLSNGTAGGKMSMGAHHYTPSIPVNTSTTQPHYNSLPRMGGNKLHVAPVNETLHIDTHSETIPYRALYNYRPQNEDELELREGDTVYVMEKCDDGWFVGSSQRTAYFGTFPGNYVERL